MKRVLCIFLLIIACVDEKIEPEVWACDGERSDGRCLLENSRKYGMVTIEPDTTWYFEDTEIESGDFIIKIIANRHHYISTAQQLAGLSYLVANGRSMKDRSFYLVNDIVLNDSRSKSVVIAWPAIGTPDNPFEGKFYGNYLSIKGIFINTVSSYQGLFGWINEAVVSNVKVDDIYVAGHGFVGGVVGLSRKSEVVGIDVSGHIVGGSSYIGGLVGYSEESKIYASRSYCDVSGDRSVGGLVGAFLTSEMEGCEATGTVIGETDYGQLIGSENNGQKVRLC